MKRLFVQRWPWLLLLLPAACVKTELIPELLEPQLRVSPVTVSLQLGESAQLMATYTDANGNDQSNLISWESRVPAIAEVEDNGRVIGKAHGQAWILAIAPAGLTDSVLVTVVADQNAVARVEIVNAPATLETGTTTNLQARAYNAANQMLTSQSFSWESSNPSLLSIDADGRATALVPGSVSVQATTSGVKSVPASIQVLPTGDLSRIGQFSGNSGYSVKGTATLRQTPNGLRLTLESNFMASNGPMLGVYLATTASGNLTAQNSLSLGALMANTGFQEYDIPAGVGLQAYNYVVIYCIPFNVRFGTAQLNN